MMKMGRQEDSSWFLTSTSQELLFACWVSGGYREATRGEQWEDWGLSVHRSAVPLHERQQGKEVQVPQGLTEPMTETRLWQRAMELGGFWQTPL